MPVTVPAVGDYNWGPVVNTALTQLGSQADQNTSDISNWQTNRATYSYTSGSTASIPNATFTTVQGWTVVGGVGAPWTQSWTSGIQTFNTAGVFFICASIGWPTYTGRSVVAIYLNGSEITRQDIANPGTNIRANECSALFATVPGSTVEVRVWQNSGGAINLSTTVPHSMFVSRLI